jgi:hypothetical protein
MDIRKFARRAVGVAPLLAALAWAGTASAQVHPWTAAGSTGTVDDTDTGIVDFVNGEARMRAAAAAGSVLNLRYNVVSLQGLSGFGQHVLRVRFRDNGAASQVRLNLRRYNQATGILTQVVAFDSNAYPAAVGYQTRQICLVHNWDFDAGPYYIEAELIKSGGAGQPAVGTIQLVPANCIP